MKHAKFTALFCLLPAFLWLFSACVPAASDGSAALVPTEFSNETLYTVYTVLCRDAPLYPYVETKAALQANIDDAQGLLPRLGPESAGEVQAIIDGMTAALPTAPEAPGEPVNPKKLRAYAEPTFQCDLGKGVPATLSLDKKGRSVSFHNSGLVGDGTAPALTRLQAEHRGQDLLAALNLTERFVLESVQSGPFARTFAEESLPDGEQCVAWSLWYLRREEASDPVHARERLCLWLDGSGVLNFWWYDPLDTEPYHYDPRPTVPPG